MATRRVIYLDHAATTPIRLDVLSAMEPYFSEEFGNPSGLYTLGQRARAAIDDARGVVAGMLGCGAGEIIFTSGGTESINLAVRGLVFPHISLAARDRAGRSDRRPPHIITSVVEHHAVGHTCRQLRDQFGVEVTEVPVDHFGRVDPEDVRTAIQKNTALISIMYANNEVGTIQPVAAIGSIAREHGIPFHTDAVQAAAYMPINVNLLKVDLLSLGAHKFYGPKGIGVLYVRRGIAFQPMQTGGGQENNMRAGTENVPSTVGLARALALAQANHASNFAHVVPLRDRLIGNLPAIVSNTRLTGHPSERLPNSASFVIDGIEAGPLLLALDLVGIAASSGSACTSASMDPSHVLTAMGYSRAQASGALRLTLGPENTSDEIDKVLEVLPEAVERLRTS
jgi:cysteine desulfurase